MSDTADHALSAALEMIANDPALSPEFRAAIREAAGHSRRGRRIDELLVREAQQDVRNLADALRPFVDAFAKVTNPGDSDLDDEQPYHITVTLGDLRRARRVLA